MNKIYLLSISILIITSCASPKKCINKALNYPTCNKCPDGMKFMQGNNNCNIVGHPLNYNDQGKIVNPILMPREDETED